MFIERAECKYTFRWRTKYACKICDPFDDMVKIKGKCEDGKRTISIVPGPDCIVLNGTVSHEYEEDCSVNKELLGTWPVIIGIGALVVLLLLATIFSFCFCKFRR